MSKVHRAFVVQRPPGELFGQHLAEVARPLGHPQRVPGPPGQVRGVLVVVSAEVEERLGQETRALVERVDVGVVRQHLDVVDAAEHDRDEVVGHSQELPQVCRQVVLADVRVERQVELKSRTSKRQS